MSISPVDWIWYPNEGFYSSQCAQYYGSSRRFDQKGSETCNVSVQAAERISVYVTVGELSTMGWSGPPYILSSTLRKSGGVLFPRGNAQAGKHAASSKRLASGAGIFTMSRHWPEV